MARWVSSWLAARLAARFYASANANSVPKQSNAYVSHLSTTNVQK
jgi:hypothetical protein